MDKHKLRLELLMQITQSTITLELIAMEYVCKALTMKILDHGTRVKRQHMEKLSKKET